MTRSAANPTPIGLNAMNFTIAWLKKDRFHIVKTSGPMTGDGFIGMSKALLADPHYKTNGHVVFDHRDLNFKNASIHDIEKIRRFHTQNEGRIGGGKSAMIFGPGCRIQWERLFDQGEKIKTENITRLFESRKDGIEWINRPDNQR